MNLEATDDNLILRPIMASGISAGGVVLPGAKQFEDGAVIISKGPDVSNRLGIGDIVVRPDPPRYTITDDDTGEILLICAEVDILAKMLPDVVPITDPARLLPLPENQDAPNTPDKEEEETKETGCSEREVYLNGVPLGGMDPLLQIRETKRLSEDDGN